MYRKQTSASMLWRPWQRAKWGECRWWDVEVLCRCPSPSKSWGRWPDCLDVGLCLTPKTLTQSENYCQVLMDIVCYDGQAFLYTCEHVQLVKINIICTDDMAVVYTRYIDNHMYWWLLWECASGDNALMILHTCSSAELPRPRRRITELMIKSAELVHNTHTQIPHHLALWLYTYWHLNAVSRTDSVILGRSGVCRSWGVQLR